MGVFGIMQLRRNLIVNKKYAKQREIYNVDLSKRVLEVEGVF